MYRNMCLHANSQAYRRLYMCVCVCMYACVSKHWSYISVEVQWRFAVRHGAATMDSFTDTQLNTEASPDGNTEDRVDMLHIEETDRRRHSFSGST